MKQKNELLEWLKVIVVAALFVIAIRTFIFSPIIVDGASMMPTYEDRDRVVINKIGTTLSSIERFDIVVFEAPDKRNFIKRIIGLPGDHIEYKQDVLYINGKQYDEPYLAQYKANFSDEFTRDFSLEQVTDVMEIPDGHYFVLGDNRRKSSDSRDNRVGLVASEQIIGKANIRFYPLDSLGWVK